MSTTPIDRLVRKEVSLGAIREMLPPVNHIGLQIAPWLNVDTDDVIFEYIAETAQEGLAPARAEDAEAELAQKDDLRYGQGRASVIDWSLKDKYTASDVMRWRSDLLLAEAAQGILSAGRIPVNYAANHASEFATKVARDDAIRRRKLDNRIEWLIMRSLEFGKIAYNDGKVKFAVDFGRPVDQDSIAPAGGLWGTEDSDPIGDLLKIKQEHFDKYGVQLDRGIISERIVNNVWRSKRFLAAIGFPLVGGTPNITLDPNYLSLNGFTPEGAMAILSRATGITFTIYDAVYRTRPVGGKIVTNNRFTSDNKVILYPSEAQLGEIDDTVVGFAKTLTSPHPEGDWQPGFYEWEQPATVDPWLHVRGSGVKAFPIFPYMEYTVTVVVL